MEHEIVLGIDVSKKFSDMCAMTADGTILLETKIFHDYTGFQHLSKQLISLADGDLHRITAVMESTAHYHRILENHLQKLDVKVMVINPLQSGSMKKMDIRNVKNDHTDARRLAQLYLLKMLKRNTTDSKIIETLKDLTRHWADIVSACVKYSNKLTALLDQSFPGFRKVFSSLRIHSALAILSEYPGPQEVHDAGLEAVRKTISKACGRGPGSKFVSGKASLLMETAQAALEIRVDRGSFPPLISLFAKILLDLRSAADQLEKQIFMAAQEDGRFWQSVQLLTSIPGIGPYSSIIILAEIGDFSRFKKPGQLVSFAGMDPKVNQSGTRFSLHNKLSKRGSPYLRSILDTCTHVAAHPGKNQALANPILAAYYQEKRRSKPANVAMCACIHKMLGYIYAVLRERKPFVLRTPEEHIVLMRANVHATVA